MVQSTPIQNVTKCFLEQLFQFIAPASTVELIKKWYIEPNCVGMCFSEQNLKNILEKIASDFPNLVLLINVLLDILSDPRYFPWGDSSVTPEDSLKYMDEEIQDRLQILVIRLLFGLKTNYINAISGEMYESKATSGMAVAVTPPNVSIQSFNRIETPISLEYAQIHGTRKFLHSVSPQHCAVLSAPNLSGGSDHYFTFQGIAAVADCIRRFPIIVFRSHMEWELHLPHRKGFGCLTPTNALIRYQGGRLCLPKISADKFIDKRLKQYIAPSGYLRPFLLEMSQNAGSLIIVGKDADISNEASRLCRLNRGYLFKRRVPLNSSKEFFAHIAKVDGALLCSSDYCYGYGFILDGAPVKGRSDRGARHNSAKSYARYFEATYHYKCLAFILSEDGMISFY